MKRLPRMDFVAQPASPLPGRVLMLAALAAFAWFAVAAWQQRLANLELQESLRPTARLSRAPVTLNTEVERRALLQAHAVAGQMTAPWNDLLSVFEEHTRPDIGLLRLEPDARSRRVRLSAEAKSLEAMVAYVSAMEADARLEDVVLLNHQLERDAPGQPVRFTLRAAWRQAPALNGTKSTQS